MTAKEEAKVLAEKWLENNPLVQCLLVFDVIGPQWGAVNKESLDKVWHKCVGMRLLFEA